MAFYRTLFERLESLFKALLSNILSIVFSSSRHPSPNLQNIRRILVVRQHDQLGDMLCAVPLLRALRSRFPSSHMSLVCSSVNYEIMKSHPYVDEVIHYDKQHFSIGEYWTFYKHLRQQQYDLAIVPATVSISLTSNIITLISGARIRVGPNRLGTVQNSSASCFTVKVDLDWSLMPHRHQTLRNLDIIQPFNISSDDCSLVVGLTEEEEVIASRRLASLRSRHKMLVGFHPGAGKQMNRWDAKNFAEVANKVAAEFNAGIIITSGPMDQQPIEEVRAHLQCEYFLVEGESIRNVAAIVDQLDLFVTNDTGIMHVAGATRTSVLALFGPTDPLQWAPIGSKHRYLFSKDGSMSSIGTNEVYAIIQTMIHEKSQI